mmetsp:Transcript_51754/g.138111  ORF Transcript_51754/g.138111 Transcript_51754/m.138111 type:complete len:200 (+) Transcript_51754:1654-2253(+)
MVLPAELRSGVGVLAAHTIAVPRRIGASPGHTPTVVPHRHLTVTVREAEGAASDAGPTNDVATLHRDLRECLILLTGSQRLTSDFSDQSVVVTHLVPIWVAVNFAEVPEHLKTNHGLTPSIPLPLCHVAIVWHDHGVVQEGTAHKRVETRVRLSRQCGVPKPHTSTFSHCVGGGGRRGRRCSCWRIAWRWRWCSGWRGW